MSIMSHQVGTDFGPTRPEFLFQVQLYCRVFFEVRHISKKSSFKVFRVRNSRVRTSGALMAPYKKIAHLLKRLRKSDNVKFPCSTPRKLVQAWYHFK